MFLRCCPERLLPESLEELTTTWPLRNEIDICRLRFNRNWEGRVRDAAGKARVQFLDPGPWAHNSAVSDGSISNNSKSKAEVFLSQQSWESLLQGIRTQQQPSDRAGLPVAFHLRKPQAKQTWHITFPTLISTLKFKGEK